MAFKNGIVAAFSFPNYDVKVRRETTAKMYSTAAYYICNFYGHTIDFGSQAVGRVPNRLEMSEGLVST